MRIWKKKIKIIAVCIIIGTAGYTQSRLELEKRKDGALKEINYTNKLLEQTQKNRKTSLNNLILLFVISPTTTKELSAIVVGVK